MASNLWKALPETSSLIIYDVSPEALERFTVELGQPPNILQASNAAEVVQQSVGTPRLAVHISDRRT